MYNVKVNRYLSDIEVVVYKKPICKKEKEIETCIVEKDGFGYEVDKKELFLYEDRNKSLTEIFESSAFHSLMVSHNRTKQKIYNYARANKWEWFFTFTFSPDKVDRFDYDEVTVLMSDWLNYMFHHNKANQLRYLIVPEKHKSGAWHFHGVFSGLDYDTWKLIFSGKYHYGEPIYNVASFPYGFTTSTAIHSSQAVSHYICKYVTKDLLDSIKNKKRYWVTKNCSCGETELLFCTKEEIQMIIDSFGEPDYRKAVETPYNDIIYYQFDM